MQLENFSRTFKVKGGQVVVYVDDTEMDDSLIFLFRTSKSLASVCRIFESEEEALNALKGYTTSDVEAILDENEEYITGYEQYLDEDDDDQDDEIELDLMDPQLN